MASTRQSAVDYIRNGRGVLLNGLQNLNLILQTLTQRKHLSDSEKDFILGQDAASADQIGRLLDVASSKGEDVCYELLRILDITRSQTFPMPVELHPELHHWISCFPFTNDPNIQTDDRAGSGPCSKYEKQLKMKATKILHEKWNQSLNVLKHKAKEKCFTYIPLVLDTDVSVLPYTKIKAYKKSRTKKLKTYIPTDKRRLSPYDLLLSKEKMILLVGKPGIGKTTVVHEILRFWADGEHSEVSYMFYFDEPLIRFLSQSANSEPLSCLLFNMYLKPGEGADIVWKDMEENSENVVLIFDGIMDIVAGSVIEKIMSKEILSDAKILITCRPEADIAGDLSDWISFKVEIQGFSENSIRAYFQWMLGVNDEQMTNISALNNLQLLSLCHVPMYAFIVTACILLGPSEADNQPSTITELYVQIFLHCIALHRDRKMDNLDQYIQERKENIMFLASSSFLALLNKTVSLAETSKSDTVLHDFLTPVTLEGSSTASETAFVFLHNTMQEFWAALFLLMTPNRIGHLLKQSQTEEGTYLKYVIIFLCGLLSQKTAAYLKSLVTPDKIKSISTQYIEDIMNAFLYSAEDDDPGTDVEVENVLYVCQCLYEYQSPEACLHFLQKVENELDLNGLPLDPHQCCAVSYAVSQSSSQTITLNLMNCTISDPGIKLILGSLTNLKSLRLSSSSMQCQIWRVALQDTETDFESLLRLFGCEMHISEKDMNVFNSASNMLSGRRQNKVKLCLHLDTQKYVSNPWLKTIYGILHNIADIRIISPDYPRRSSDTWKSAVDSFHLDLFLQGALHEIETGQMCVQRLLTVNRHLCSRSPSYQSSFIRTLYLRAKQMGVLEELKPVFQAWPDYWVLDLSRRDTSYLVELLKLQEVKKTVELLLSQEEYELKIFLQCLPYVSQVRFNDYIHIQEDDTKAAIKLLVDLFICASESGDDETLKMLYMVCSYESFPFTTNMEGIQSEFLWDLFSYIKDYESQGEKKSVLPILLPIFQSAPAVWIADLSKEIVKVLVILQVLKFQEVKKPVELSHWSYEHDKLAVLLQCLPHVSQLSLRYSAHDRSFATGEAVHFIVRLFVFALETGDETLKMLSSVCCYSTFPFADDKGEIQSAFLLDLYSCVREYESETGKSLLPALLPIYQTAPAVWVLDLSKGVSSLLHLTMQLQTVKRPVELRGWSTDANDLRNILECAPHMLQLNCSERFFQTLCEVLSAGQNWNPEKVAGILKPVNFSVTLMEMLPKRICKTVGSVLSWTSPEKNLSLSLIPERASCQGMNVLFTDLTMFRKLRMNEHAALKVSKMVRLRFSSVTIEELSLVLNNPCPNERRMYKVISSLASILRVWTVGCLDLSESHLEGHFLISLLCLDRPFSVRMSDENLHQLAEIVYEAQNDFLTWSFLEKVSGDLSSSNLPWNLLQYLLQKSNIPLTLDPQKNRFDTINMQDLLQLLHMIHLSGTNSQFVKKALKEICARRAGHLVTSLLRTSDSWINLSEQELDRHDCSALRFALHYSDDVKVNLSGATIPKEETESILLLMHRVSNLSVDRHLLLDLLRACSVSREQRRVTMSLMMAMQNKLDFSQPSTVSVLEQGSREPMVLNIRDCQSISSAIQLSACDTDLIIFDCQAEDCALEQLFPALSHIRLRLGKPQLLQLILLTLCDGKRDSWNRAKDLSRALGKEIDLSHTSLDCHSCESLGLVLEHSEELTHLNLSHCQLTDSCLVLLFPHLHKVLFLDLSNNNITDYGARNLQKILTSTQTVCIFNNFITDMRLFIKNLHYQETLHNTPTYVQAEKENISKSTNVAELTFLLKAPLEVFTKRITTVAMFDPEIYVHDNHIIYRFECEIGGDFRCSTTELIFGMKGRGCVEYKVVNWGMHCFSKHSYTPAGPLYEMQTLTGEMYQLHLPHCETEADSLGDISVAHIHEGSTDILTPVRLTCTHVGVRISSLSCYGTVRRKGSMNNYVRGQVLLFLEQINKNEQRLWVFLLSRNVSPNEIKKQQQEYNFIKTSSDCMLRQKGKYCLTSNLQNYKVQPKTYTFHAVGDADHHSAFELFIGSEVSELQVKVHEKQVKKLRTRWNRRVILSVNDKCVNKIKTEEEENMTSKQQPENVFFTEQNWKLSLCNLLDQLTEENVKKLKHLMKNTTNHVSIPRGKLENKERPDLADLMIEAWGFQGSVYAVRDFMKNLPRNDNAVTSILNPYLRQFGL